MTTFLPTTDGASGGVPAPRAVLLDMDGTLVDTEGLWWDAEVAVFAGLGHTLADHHRTVVSGGPMGRVGRYLIESTGAAVTLEELGPLINAAFLTRLASGFDLMPGARRLLDELTGQGVPTALVSASDRAVVDVVSTALGRESFTLTVAGNDLRRNKPHPDPYLAAAAGLGVAPEECVAVEDTLTGVAAAEAAGCQVVVVPSVVPIPPAHRRSVVASLTEVDLRYLRGLWPAARAGEPAGPL
ncbi:HAD family hydrolase [Streptomyces spiramenti]|uniref:HAD family phosphatase n=1 Tax=Streptomyces spiramenti TaxID=2720606 RepID=A0ABX1AFZ3_9ACTN|nr:HAD family phosphatase [Streptomyces spiramenti]NJP66068.1 HAD family phosphatase [Streptomyces spiramenti]